MSQAYLPVECLCKLRSFVMLDEEKGGLIRTFMKAGVCQMELEEIIDGSGPDRSKATSGAKAVASVPVGKEIFKHRPLCGDEERHATIVFHTHPVAPTTLPERKFAHFAPPTPMDFYVHGIYATIVRKKHNLPPLNAMVVAYEGIYMYGALPKAVEKYQSLGEEAVKANLESYFKEYATKIVNSKLLSIDNIRNSTQDIEYNWIQRHITDNVYFDKLREEGFWCHFYKVPFNRSILIDVYDGFPKIGIHDQVCDSNKRSEINPKRRASQRFPTIFKRQSSGRIQD